MNFVRQKNRRFGLDCVALEVGSGWSFVLAEDEAKRGKSRENPCVTHGSE